ncbi:MAG: prepilin-type N-terminal cleavage/methylation domain-containing protein [Phycisphaerales bacterium]
MKPPNGMSLLEVVIATALLSLAAVSLLGWFSSTALPVRENELVLGSASLSEAADQIVLSPDRFGITRAPDGRYRWEAATDLRDRTGAISGTYRIELLKASATTDYLLISGKQGSATRWFIIPPGGRR